MSLARPTYCTLIRTGTLGSVVLALLISGCRLSDLPQPSMSPAVTLVPRDAWKEAERAAAKVPGSTVVVGHGRSMEPLYPPGTILVLQPVGWKNLHAGMTALYKCDAEAPYQLVAHVLLAREHDSWLAQVLANRAPDLVRLTPDNYVGIVVAAFR